MTATLYLDVFFLVNFGMDYLLLSLAGRLLRLALLRRRLVLAALLGAGWSCLDLILPGSSGWTELLLTWIGLGGGMVLLAFGTGKDLHLQWGRKRGPGSWDLSYISSCLIAFWLVSLMAGGIFSVLEEQSPAGYYLSGTRAVRQWRLLPLCLVAGGIYFALGAGIRLIKKRRKEQEILCRVKLSYRGREVEVTALWDTGNQLYEPYGGQPVHVVTREVSLMLCQTIPQLIYIPFRTVGSEYGMMPGIRIDSMEVEKEEGRILHYERPWLAISKRPLSLENRYGMLLNGSER